MIISRTTKCTKHDTAAFNLVINYNSLMFVYVESDNKRFLASFHNNLIPELVLKYLFYFWF